MENNKILIRKLQDEVASFKAEILKLQRKIEAGIDDLLAERKVLISFAKSILQIDEGEMLDLGVDEIQSAAVMSGLAEMKDCNEPCSEWCDCVNEEQRKVLECFVINHEILMPHD